MLDKDEMLAELDALEAAELADNLEVPDAPTAAIEKVNPPQPVA